MRADLQRNYQGFQEVKVPVIRCVRFYVVDYLKIEEVKLR